MVEQRDIDDSLLQAKKDRTAGEATVTEARRSFAVAQAQLAEAERYAKGRRQALNATTRARIELERRFGELNEAEAVARARRQQSEQRAKGLAAAAAFAAQARLDAEEAGDHERAEKERLVEERATKQAAASESRVLHDLADERKISALRAEVEGHISAEREMEATLTRARGEAEARIEDLRRRVEHASEAVDAAELALQHVDGEHQRLMHERTLADQQAREQQRQQRTEIESRIAQLRAAERAAASQRQESERALAQLLDNPADAQPPVAETPRHQTVTPAPEPVTTNAIPPAVAASAAETTGQGTSDAVRRPASVSANGAGRPAPIDVDTIFPAMSGIVRNLFGRAKRAPEPIAEPEDGTSVADRIARDFGLLGHSEPTPPRPPTAA